MTSFRHFLALSALMAFAGFGSAQAQGISAGDYSLAVGSSAPCGVTLATDGTASLASACSANAGQYSRWSRTPTGLVFEDHSGQVVAILKSKGDGYAGTLASGGHNVSLTPATQTAAH